MRTTSGDEGRRLEILEATWQLIAERGFRAVRIADIAAVCGTSTGTIHYYFPGKQDLLTQALRHCVSQALSRQQSELHEIEGSRARLLRLVELQLPKPGQVRAEWLIWLQYWPEAALRPELRSVHAEFYAGWQETIRALVRRGRDDGEFRDVDPGDVTARLTAMIDGLAIQLLTGVPGMDLARMRRLVVEYIDDHVVARRSGATRI